MRVRVRVRVRVKVRVRMAAMVHTTYGLQRPSSSIDGRSRAW